MYAKRTIVTSLCCTTLLILAGCGNLVKRQDIPATSITTARGPLTTTPTIYPQEPPTPRTPESANVSYLSGSYVSDDGVQFTFAPNGTCRYDVPLVSGNGYYEILNSWEVRLHFAHGIHSTIDHDVAANYILVAWQNGAILTDRNQKYVYKLRSSGG